MVLGTNKTCKCVFNSFLAFSGQDIPISDVILILCFEICNPTSKLKDLEVENYVFQSNLTYQDPFFYKLHQVGELRKFETQCQSSKLIMTLSRL